MKKLSVSIMAIAILALVGIIGCEKSDLVDPNPSEQLVTSNDLELAENQGGERVSVSGDPVHIDFYNKWDGWPPESNFHDPNCYVAAGECTCPNSICFIGGFRTTGGFSGQTGYDQTAVEGADLYFTTGGFLVAKFTSVDPSVYNPDVSLNNIVPITGNFFVDPAVAASLGYTSIEVIAGNYEVDYTYNTLGEILINVNAI